MWSDWAAEVRCGFTADCWQNCGSLSGVESRKQQQMWPGRRDYANRACVCVCLALFRRTNTHKSERGLTVWYNKQTKRQRIRGNGWSVWEACLFTLACLIDRWRGAEVRVLESLDELFKFYIYSLRRCFQTPADMWIKTLTDQRWVCLV